MMRLLLLTTLGLCACGTTPLTEAAIENNCRQDFEQCLRTAGGQVECSEQRAQCEAIGAASREQQREKEAGFEAFKREREKAAE